MRPDAERLAQIAQYERELTQEAYEQYMAGFNPCGLFFCMGGCMLTFAGAALFIAAETLDDGLNTSHRFALFGITLAGALTGACPGWFCAHRCCRPRDIHRTHRQHFLHSPSASDEADGLEVELTTHDPEQLALE